MIGELPNPPVLAVFTVQKEVAERACSLPPNMNLLSASIGFWAESSMGGIIKKESFRPVPKIDSAILIIRRKKNIPEDAAKYYETMRALFKQPRKTILNNLSDGLKKTKEEAADIIKNAELDIASRSQNLSVEDILNIANKTPR
jgi:16S rRNA (adenine1518-N6/adenine1519-N6)-dimethyltransferase